MSPEELNYYRDRARMERKCAEEATNPHAVEIHLKLACLYEALVDLEDLPSPTSQMVGSSDASPA